MAHDLWVFCLGEEHTHSLLEGAECAHCEKSEMKKLRSNGVFFFEGIGEKHLYPVARVPRYAEARW